MKEPCHVDLRLSNMFLQDYCFVFILSLNTISCLITVIINVWYLYTVILNIFISL